MANKNHHCIDNPITSQNKTVIGIQSETSNELNENAITAILATYAGTQVNLTGLTDEDKRKKAKASVQAVQLLADSLGAKGLQQNMLIVQLLGIHELQQKLLPYASRSINHPEDNQYFVNAITKLSNVFVSQVTLLQKLQGQSQQKVVVEHLHIHEGAQAVVGQLNAFTEKKGVTSEK